MSLLMRIPDAFLSLPTAVSGFALASIVGGGIAGISLVDVLRLLVDPRVPADSL
jgi:ABC-type dipeptide/oligopeptide/nickel transport system permease subunit